MPAPNASLQSPLGPRSERKLAEIPLNNSEGQIFADSRDTQRRRRRLLPAFALLMGLALVTAGCNTLAVTSNAGVLTATSGTNTTLTWFFFNQDFKNFAATRSVGPMGTSGNAEYSPAIAAEPGSKFFSVTHVVGPNSTTSGSGAGTQVLLKANEFANQGDGINLSATESIQLSPPAYGFSWLTGGASTQVTTVVPSDLCGLYVMVISDGSVLLNSTFYSNIVATTETYSCSGGTPVSIQNGDTEQAGPPGIFLTVNAVMLGREAEGSPVYYGAERVAVTSTFLLTVTSVSNVAPSVVTLAEGTIDADGSFSSVAQLPPLLSGTYKVRMRGQDTGGNTLELTSQVTVADKLLTSIGAYIPKIH